jgi:hypothetical protein
LDVSLDTCAQAAPAEPGKSADVFRKRVIWYGVLWPVCAPFTDVTATQCWSLSTKTSNSLHCASTCCNASPRASMDPRAPDASLLGSNKFPPLHLMVSIGNPMSNRVEKLSGSSGAACHLPNLLHCSASPAAFLLGFFVPINYQLFVAAARGE